MQSSPNFSHSVLLLQSIQNVLKPNLKNANSIFRLPISVSSSLSTSDTVANTKSKLKGLVVDAHVDTTVGASKTFQKSSKISSSRTHFNVPANLFAWKIENENQKKLRLRKVISNAEDLLSLNRNLMKSLISPLSTSQMPSVTPNLTLKSLFDDQVFVISSYINQLMDSTHPIVNYARNMFQSHTESSFVSSASLQLRSIVVLLVAKAIGLPLQIEVSSKEIQDNIENRQKALSEITELIYAAHMLHRTLVDMPKSDSHSLTSFSMTEDEAMSLHQGNKLATLMGDFLLAKTSKSLAILRTARVTELMSDTIANITESEFISVNVTKSESVVKDTPNSSESVTCRTTSKDYPLSLSYDKWMRRTQLSIGSLLGNSCYCAMVFSEHEDPVRQLAFHLGSKIALVLQAYKDLAFFDNREAVSSKGRPQYFDLWTLPVIYQLQENPHLIEPENIDYAKIFEEVQSSQIALAKTRETLSKFQQNAARLVSQLPRSDSSPSAKILKELILTLS